MNKIKKLSIIGFIFTLVVGTLLHFVYGWSGNNVATAIFSPVNESVWEHLKMLFFPVLVFGIVEYFTYGKELKNFIPVKVMSVILGMAFIVVFYYLYIAIWDKNELIVGILLFILAIALSYLFSAKFLKKQDKFSSETANLLGWTALLLLIFIFVYFTFNPPEFVLFKDPVSGEYGI